MTGLLESIDELQEHVAAAKKFRLDDRDVKFSPSFVQTLKANLGPDGRNFIVTESTIQWEGKDGLAIVPAALVFSLSQFSEYLARLYQYHKIWNQYRKELADNYQTWQSMDHSEIHQNFLPTIVGSDLNNADMALFAEWLAPPENHVSKKFGLGKKKINTDGTPRSDLFQSEVTSLLPFTNDGGGKSVGNLAVFFGKLNLFKILNNSSNFVTGDTIDGLPSTPTDLPPNLIYYGAPGTGKSHEAETTIPCEPQHFHRVVFHADYQNADFIGSIKPAIKDDEATYEFEKGPLTEALIDALTHPDTPIVLMIEELNRGNAASIFGETFQLLDRTGNGKSKFPIKITGALLSAFSDITDVVDTGALYFPANFFIIATMNNSDQAVFPLDTAFKRRWTMKHIPIDWKKIQRADVRLAEPKIKIEAELYSWPELGQAINSVMESQLSNIPEDRYLGPFFLSPDELLCDELNPIISGKVLIYLWEDVVKYEGKQALFDAGIKTFQTLQERFNGGQNVFSSEVLERLNHLRLDREPITLVPEDAGNNNDSSADSDIH